MGIEHNALLAGVVSCGTHHSMSVWGRGAAACCHVGLTQVLLCVLWLSVTASNAWVANFFCTMNTEQFTTLKSQQWWAAMQNHPCKQHYHNHIGILRNSIKTIGQHDITMAIAWHNRWHHNGTIVNDVKSVESDWITVTGLKTTLTLILPTTSDILKYWMLLWAIIMSAGSCF